MKIIHKLMLMIIFPFLLAACDTAGDLWASVGKSDGNVVGIIFQNGVECLGEEAQPKEGDVLYVSLEGDDSNPGAETAPLRTLAYALCNLRPGQTLNIAPGVYKESIIMGAFGDSSAPIIIRAHPDPKGGQHPVLEGESTRSIGIAMVERPNRC